MILLNLENPVYMVFACFSNISSKTATVKSLKIVYIEAEAAIADEVKSAITNWQKIATETGIPRSGKILMRGAFRI